MGFLLGFPAFTGVELDLEHDSPARLVPTAVYALIFVPVPPRSRLDVGVSSLGDLPLDKLSAFSVVIKIEDEGVAYSIMNTINKIPNIDIWVSADQVGELFLEAVWRL